MSYQSPSQVDVALLSGLEDIRCGNAVPLSSSPSSFHGSLISSSDSDDASMVDGCRVYGLVGGKETYGSLEEFAADIQRLGKQQNNCLDEIISLKGEIKLLKAVIARLEGDMVAHEAELTIGRGEPVWSSRETIRESVDAEAAKRMNGDVTPSPPPPAGVGAARVLPAPGFLHSPPPPMPASAILPCALMPASGLSFLLPLKPSPFA